MKIDDNYKMMIEGITLWFVIFGLILSILMIAISFDYNNQLFFNTGQILFISFATLFLIRYIFFNGLSKTDKEYERIYNEINK